jgi:hypothetical protein
MNKKAIVTAGNTQPTIGTRIEGKNEAAMSVILVEITNARAKFTANWPLMLDC